MIRNDNTILDNKGQIDKTKFCRGPFISTNNGMDFPCCCTCLVMRNCSRKDEDFFSSSNNLYRAYTDRLVKKNPDYKTCFSLSICGKDFFIREKAKTLPELELKSYKYCLLDQFEILKTMGFIFYERIDLSSISYTDFGIPVFFPDFDNYKPPEMKKNYGSKRTDNGKIIILDKEKILRDDDFSIFYVLYELIEKLSGISMGVERNGNIEYSTIDLEVSGEKIITEKSLTNKIEKIKGNKDDKYVILDLDRTLIHSEIIDLASGPSNIKESFIINLTVRKNFMQTRIRNHLNKFLNDLRENNYKVIVWSAGCESYVKIIVSVIFKDYSPDYVFTFDHVNPQNKKILSLIGDYIDNFNVENCRLVDDDYELHAHDQEKYFLHIPEFGKTNDDVLENYIDIINKSFR